MNREAPIDHEAERQVIAWLLGAAGDDREAVEVAVSKLTEHHFDDERCRLTFEAVGRLVTEGSAPSTAAVADALHAAGITKPAHHELVRLVADTGTSADAASSAIRRLEELRRWRALLDVGQAAARAWRRGGATASQVAAQAASDLDAMLGESEQHVLSMSAIARERVADLVANKGKPVRRVRCGWEPYDRLSGGFGETELHVLAGPAGGGKSATASHIFEAMATAGQSVLVASAEMAGWEISDRLLSKATQIPGSWIRDNRLDDEKLDALARAARRESWSRILVLESDDQINVQQLRRLARAYKRRANLGLVVVDYLQLITSLTAPGERGRDRTREVSAVARGLKNIARTLGVPVLALSQFNRDAVRDGGEPELWHLKESGEIEQASNVITFVWRREDDPQGQLRLICKKHRSGPANTSIRLFWEPSTVTFTGEVV